MRRDDIISLDISFMNVISMEGLYNHIEIPCEPILTKPHATVLDREWLQWKKASRTNR